VEQLFVYNCWEFDCYCRLRDGRLVKTGGECGLMDILKSRRGYLRGPERVKTHYKYTIQRKQREMVLIAV
jgi:hypothetical protein